ncbi:MAG: hypothetical protein GF384_05805, partial [Elusimicrobia bacterium]|nr:hypothetical protein [Elusimicrobiota bacterium]MBD3412273.1 hypothetical protein [Elusimicrobiota bacterium]
MNNAHKALLILWFLLTYCLQGISHAAFKHHTIMSSGDAGYFPSIAIGTGNQKYFVFKRNDKYIYYCQYGYNPVEIVPETVNIKGIQLDIDKSNNLHMAYYRGGSNLYETGKLYYKKKTGSSWSISYKIAESHYEGIVGDQFDIAVSPNSTIPHVAHNEDDGSRYTIHYRTSSNNGASWTINDRIKNSGKDPYPSLAVGSDNVPRVSYYKSSLNYAIKSGSWSTQTVDPANYSGKPSKILLDSSKRAHIVYCNYVEKKLYYTYYSGSSWTTPKLISSGIKYCDAEIDSANTVHVAFISENKKLYYVSSANWASYVEVITDVGEECSIAVDSANHPHIAYQKDSSKDMMYAEYVDDPWIKVDSPNGGEKWGIATHNITWSSGGYWDTNQVRIYYSIDSGKNYVKLLNDTLNDGKYEWRITNFNTTKCRIKIAKLGGLPASDESNKDFTVDTTAPQPSIDSVTVDSESSITWTSTQPGDVCPPVYYYFHSQLAGGGSENTQNWSTTYTHNRTGLTPDTYYEAGVKGKDSADPPNESSMSSYEKACTKAKKPGYATNHYTNKTNEGFTAHWTVNGNPAHTVYQAELWQGNSFQSPSVRIEFTDYSTATSWEISGLTAGLTYRVRVKAKNQANLETDWLELDAVEPLGDPLIDLTYPDGGEHCGNPTTIRWTRDGYWDEDTVDIIYSVNGSNPQIIIEEHSNITALSYDWDTSGLNLENVKILIRKHNDVNISDESQKYFIVDTQKPQPSINQVTVNSESSITWTSTQPEDKSSPLFYNFESKKQGGGEEESSGWLEEEYTYNRNNLSPNTYYEAAVQAKDSAVPSNEGPLSDYKKACTWAEEPTKEAYTNISNEGFDANWSLGNNPETVTVFQAELWEGDSFEWPSEKIKTMGWKSDTTWEIDGLGSEKKFRVRVKAKNQEDIETDWVDLGIVATFKDTYVYVTSPNTQDIHWSSEHEITWQFGGFWNVNTVNIDYYNGEEWEP